MYGPLFTKLDADVGMIMKANEIDVIGQKAIIEASGFAKQKNGKPYNNR